MWELDCEDSWAPKNWCFWTVVLEKTLKSPLNCKEIQPVHPKGDQSWVFIGRTDAKAETPVLCPPRAKSWLIGKDSDAGRDWGQEEKGTTEDEMAGWHHRLDGHEFGCIPGVGDGQGGLECYNSWGCNESDTTEQLNWTELNSLEVVMRSFFSSSYFYKSLSCKILSSVVRTQLHIITLDICRLKRILFSTWFLASLTDSINRTYLLEKDLKTKPSMVKMARE